MTNDDSSFPLRACFGVGCPHHHRCARYAAVVDSTASRTIMGTCRRDDTYPMFVDVGVDRSVLPG